MVSFSFFAVARGHSIVYHSIVANTMHIFLCRCVYYMFLLLHADEVQWKHRLSVTLSFYYESLSPKHFFIQLSVLVLQLMNFPCSQNYHLLNCGSHTNPHSFHDQSVLLYIYISLLCVSSVSLFIKERLSLTLHCRDC